MNEEKWFAFLNAKVNVNRRKYQSIERKQRQEIMQKVAAVFRRHNKLFIADMCLVFVLGVAVGVLLGFVV